MTKPPVFPLLRVNARHIQRIEAPGFSKENDLYLANGAYAAGTYLIDFVGNRFDVVSWSKRRRSYNPLDLLSKYPWFYVELELLYSNKQSIDKTKYDLMELILDNRWYRQSYESKEEFVRWFERILTYPELMRSISLYGGLLRNAKSIGG